MSETQANVAKFLASKIEPDELEEIVKMLECNEYGLDEQDRDVLSKYMELAFEWHQEQGNYPKDWKDADTGIYRLETHFDEQGHPHGTDIVNGEIVRY